VTARSQDKPADHEKTADEIRRLGELCDRAHSVSGNKRHDRPAPLVGAKYIESRAIEFRLPYRTVRPAMADVEVQGE
jgi:hypothetical protein